MIVIEIYSRNESSIVSFTEDGIGIGSLLVSQKNKGLIPSIQQLIDRFNTNQSESDNPRAATVTGRND